MKFHWRVTGAAAILTLTMTGDPPRAGSDLQNSCRIGVVAVQDRSKQGLSRIDADGMLGSLLRAEGLSPVPLEFQPPADVEYAAQRAQCEYILYTDIVAVRETAPSQFAKALQRLGGSKPGQGSTAVEIEFRLFAVSEVLPRLSKALSASSSRTGSPTSIAIGSGYRAALSEALAQEVRMVRAEVVTKNTVRTEF